MRRLVKLGVVALALAAGCGSKKGDDQGSAPAAPPAPGGPAAPARPVTTDPTESGLAGADGKPVAVTGGTKADAVKAAVDMIAKEEAVNDKGNTPAVAPHALMSFAAGESFEDRGDFTLVVEPGNDTPVRLRMKEVLGKLVIELNTMVKLPRPLPVRMKKCGEPNAFYNPDQHDITFCDELPESLYRSFGAYKKDPAVRDRSVINAAVGTFLHELGHALVGEWQIPALGRQEDVADQLAAFVLIGAGEETTEAVLDWAESYLAFQAFERGEVHNDYTDVHSLDEQRFYNLTCLVYGASPKTHESMVDDLDLPLSRAVRCQREYEMVRSAWAELLAHILIKPG
jgi:putative metallopeptidase DUF4344